MSPRLPAAPTSALGGAGDSPSGAGWTRECDKNGVVRTVLLPVPSGESPDGTGESPVPLRP